MPISPIVSFPDSRAIESAIVDRLADGQWWPFEPLAASVGAHTRDVTLALQRLRQNGYVEAEGEKRAKRYRLLDVAAATRAFAEPPRLPLMGPEPAPAPPGTPGVPLERLEAALQGYEGRLAAMEAEVAAMRQFTAELRAEVLAALPRPAEPRPEGHARQLPLIVPEPSPEPAPRAAAPEAETPQARLLRLRERAASEARIRTETLERKIRQSVPPALLARAQRGYELMNARGVLAQAEFAWLDRRVALLMPIQRNERQAFEKHGWTVFDASALDVTNAWSHLTRVLAA